jgi:hypothetical protein
MQYSINHTIHFQADRDDTWPESLPWPEWKPETDKSYRPERFTFVIGWTHDENPPRVPNFVNVFGTRILKSGKTGSEVSCSYYGDGINGLPKAMHDLLHSGLLVASEAKDSYEQDEDYR